VNSPAGPDRTVPARPADRRRDGRVLVIGDLATDIMIRLTGPPVVGSDRAAEIRSTGGGAGANTAVWLAFGGVPVTLAARVGDDEPGRDRVAELRQAGVEPAVAADPGARTASIAVLVTPDAERTMFTDRGAADRLAADDVVAVLERPDIHHLHLSGYVLLGDGSRDAGLAALATARRRGLSISVDAASAAPLEAVGAEDFLGWITGVDLLLANAAEAAVLARTTDPARAAARLSDTENGTPARPGAVGAVVVKNGAGGAWWRGKGGASWVAAQRSGPVVDSTGAGDAFAAGLLAAWLAGAAPGGALAAGARAARLTLGRSGARPPAPGA
jgi:sugar/nucleoside kinase (ribokinase family)